ASSAPKTGSTAGGAKARRSRNERARALQHEERMTSILRSINPATGATLAEYPALSPADLEQRLARAAAVAPRWRRTPVAERAAVVARLADLLEREKDRLGRLMTL